MEIPEAVMDRAKRLDAEIRRADDHSVLAEEIYKVIAQALLDERLAGKREGMEECAEIAKYGTDSGRGFYVWKEINHHIAALEGAEEKV